MNWLGFARILQNIRVDLPCSCCFNRRENGGYAERALHSSIVDPGFQSNAQLIADALRAHEATLVDLSVARRVAVLIATR